MGKLYQCCTTLHGTQLCRRLHPELSYHALCCNPSLPGKPQEQHALVQKKKEAALKKSRAEKQAREPSPSDSNAPTAMPSRVTTVPARMRIQGKAMNRIPRRPHRWLQATAAQIYGRA